MELAATKILVFALVLSSSVQTLWGCFVSTGDCPNRNVTFWLYTNQTRNDPKRLDPLRLNPYDFQPTLPIKILIHGFTGHRDYWPNPQLRPVLLNSEDLYVISVDYGRLAGNPCYREAVLNTPLIGRCLAQLIDNLINQNIVSSDQLHVIGFSLGSQVAGQTANFVKQKLKHITGLDPAKPLFSHVPDSKRLDAGDAEFVDIIHSNVMERGILRNLGHVDFYPNFKQLVQPGCERDEIPGSCNHHRAVEFYAESIDFSLGFWGRQCESWVIYLLNLCPATGPIALMGYHASPTTRGSYFLDTSKTPPYALGIAGAVIPRNTTEGLEAFSSDFADKIETTLATLFVQKEINELRKKGQL